MVAVRPMIVGAGPVGLAASLFLRHRGIETRVVEMRERPSRESRALVVNPRTLALLEPTGVTDSMLEIGKPLEGVRIHRHGRIIGSIDLGGVHDRYPFVLALSQSTTERLLERAFEHAGGRVERRVQMQRCSLCDEGVEVVLAGGGEMETTRVPWMLAADGAHSTARKQLGLDFPGRAFRREWYLADIALESTLEQQRAHLLFTRDGRFVFMARVIDPLLEQERDAPIWRVMGNHSDPVSMLDGVRAVGEPVWESSFHISHRVCASFDRGGVYFAGDSAHIHSPVGARGMNLGIEDAWVLAELAHKGELDRYGAMRRRVDRRVVRKIALISRLAAAEPVVLGVLRTIGLPIALRLPIARQIMRRTVMGLDHDLTTV